MQQIGLAWLLARERAMEHWLRNEALPAYDAYKADPSRGLPLDEVRAGLAKRHQRTAERG
jgi:hypothetical protein